MTPDKLFLYDFKAQHHYSYNKFLEDLNAVQQVSLYCRAHSLYSILLQITAAAIHQVDLVLLDSDFSDLELNNLHLSIQQMEQQHAVEPVCLNDLPDLLSLLENTGDWHLTLFTSGTTGIPKQITHTMQSLTRAVRKAERHAQDVWGFAYNPTHIAGLQVFFQALLNGNSLVNLFEASRDTVLELIREFQITNISATPTFFRMLLPLHDKFDSVRKLTSGGEKFDARLSAELLQGFPNAKLRNVYASTEAGTILESKDEGFSITDSSLCRIIDGEFQIHKSLLGQGSELALIDGEWYATGDLVEILSEEPFRFRFLQRRNEMINIGGYKVNPCEVEQVLESHPHIRQSYVYGKANPVLGNVLMADIVSNEPLSEKELRNFLSRLLQPYKVPRVFNFVASIELTRSGKIKRN
jgi:acyl-coenzyme A synthetase/AMP-(fatty) acid ligase